MRMSALMGALLFAILPALATATFDHAVINQIQLDSVAGTGGTEDDWVELFNPTGNPVDLTGWSIQKTSATGGSLYRKELTGVIPAGGYFLVVRNHADTAPSLLALADILAAGSGFSLSDDNTVYLVSNNDDLTGGSDPDIIDRLGLGSSSIFESAAAPNPNDGESLERLAQDTDDNLADFFLQNLANPRNTSTAVSPAPAPPPSPAPPPPSSSSGGGSGGGSSTPVYSSAVVISEFLPNPDGPDDGEEWVELYNNSDSSVDLSGWMLDDEAPSNGGIGTSAQVMEPGSLIEPRGYLVIRLGESVFALNNTGGDVVRLFWPNKQLAAQVSYKQTAKDDYAYARTVSAGYDWTGLVTKAAANLFDPPPVPQSAVAAEESGLLVEPIPPGLSDKIKINELMPDPPGADSGQEWVELINLGLEPIYVHNWILDDGEPESDIGKTAWKIQSPTIPPGGVAVLVIPAGKFALDNTSAETLRLFDPYGVLLDFVSYPQARPGLSYQKAADGTWLWAVASANAANLATPSVTYQIVINELFPEPRQGVEEFMELKNLGSEPADLTGWKLSDGAGSFTIANARLAADGFLVIAKSDSGLALNNYGPETVTLTDAQGVILTEVTYQDPPKNYSYNYTADGEYVWSMLVTPGQDNQIKTGQVQGAILPRSGGRNYLWPAVALWVIVWYGYCRLTANHHEQTRTD